MIRRPLWFVLATLVPLPSHDGAERPHDNVSIVVFEEAVRLPNPVRVAAQLTKEFDRPFTVEQPKDAKAPKTARDNYVFQTAPTAFLIKIADDLVLVEFMRESRADPDGLADQIDEGRLRHAVRIHRTMLDVRGALRPADDNALAAQLRLVAKVTAALLDDRNSLAISFSLEPRLFVVDSLTRDALRAENPVKAMIEGGEHPPVVPIAADDPLMLAAIAEARRRWPEFVSTFAAAGKPSADARKFSVKFAAREGEIVEHLWLTVTEIDGDKVRGTVGNRPVQVKGFELDKAVEIRAADVEDWLCFGDAKVDGGFTVKVVSKRMEEAAAKARAERLKEAESKLDPSKEVPAGSDEAAPKRR